MRGPHTAFRALIQVLSMELSQLPKRHLVVYLRPAMVLVRLHSHHVSEPFEASRMGGLDIRYTEGYAQTYRGEG